MESGYRAIVTGGAQGIGLAITSALLDAGAKVHFLDISSEAGIKTKKELDEKYGSGRATFVQCDVTNKDELKKAFYEAKDKLGGLNVVCNNAGRSHPTEERTLWKEMIDLNLSACIHGCMLSLDLMKKSQGGSGGVIINTASIAGVRLAHGINEVYSATKAGVIHYTRCAAMTSMADGVRINCVCPSATDTKLATEAIENIRKLNLFQTDRVPISEEEVKATIMPPSRVAEEVMNLIQDETANGEALVILKDQKSYFHKFK